VILEGKRLLITGVITRDSIAYHAAEQAQKEGAEVVLSSFGRVRRMTERAAQRLPQPADVLELDVNKPEDLDALTYYAFGNLRIADSPANCAPSLHVSGVYMSSFIFLDEQREKFPFFFTWATCIALSTLTTKQHYFIDIATGFLMAVIMYWIFHRLVNYRAAGGLQLSR